MRNIENNFVFCFLVVAIILLVWGIVKLAQWVF